MAKTSKPTIRLTDILAENWGKSQEEINAIIYAPEFDYELVDDREGVPLSAYTPEEREILKKILIGDRLTEAEREMLIEAENRYFDAKDPDEIT